MALLKFRFYDGNRIMTEAPTAKYYMVIGERSNGKTYWWLRYALQQWFTTGKEFAYLRRFDVDIKPSELNQLFAALTHDGTIKKLAEETGKPWTTVVYERGKFRCAYIDEETDKLVKCDEQCGYAFSLTSMEHKKGYSYPLVTTIIFDEFLTRTSYLPNETTIFQNCLSTIIRLRDDAIIAMLGNTVNKWCPYFNDMGLKHIRDQKQGTIDVYHYGESELVVAVEYCKSSGGGTKPSNVYFAFDDPRLTMITDGLWETGQYPRLHRDYNKSDVASQFFIEFDHETLCGKVISWPDDVCIFIRRSKWRIRDEEGQLRKPFLTSMVYTDKPANVWNVKMGILHHNDRLTKLIQRLLAENKVYYADNDVGEVFRNYLLWSANLDIRRE